MNRKQPQRRQKRAVTLIEIMIVIFLIGLIGGALAFNLKGSLDEGKVFKTKQGIDQIHNILMLEVAQGLSVEDAVRGWKEIVHKSPLAGKPESLMQDGWGEEYRVVSDANSNDIVVQSASLDRYSDKHRKVAR